VSSLDAHARCKLRICSRHVASPGADLIQEPFVECPRRDACATLDECARCNEYAGLSFDGERGRSFVVCRSPDVALAVGRTRDTVAEIMTADVLCLREDLTLAAATELFLRDNVSAAPVVDAARGPIGMLSRSDLLRERFPGAMVSEAMTPLAFSVRGDALITRAAALMAYEGIHQVPVVSEDEKVIGLLTSLDILRWIAQREGKEDRS
jgi:CBS domain-containing protein